MSNKKQTSVEFLIKEFSDILSKIYTSPTQDLLLIDAINQAKELHKQEIIYAYEVGFSDGWNDAKYDNPKYSDAEQYHKEKYE